jgi:6-phosphofructokinase 1
MVGLEGSEIRCVQLADIVGHPKNVPLDGDVIQTARDLGTSLGD